MKKMIRCACAGAAMALLSLSAHAQNYTGVQGPGWREIAMPLASTSLRTAQAVGTYTTRNAVLIEIDSPTGLANAPIPAAAKDNILSDGFGSGPIYVDRDVVNAIANGTAATTFAEYIEPDSTTAYNSAEGRESPAGRATRTRITPQGLFCNSGWRTYTLSRNIPFNAVNASKGIAGGSLTFDGRMNGSADVRIVVEYKKSDWSLCIPYTVRFKEAGAVGSINLNDSRLALTASVSTTVAETANRHDLYKSNGVVWLGPIPVWYTYAIPMDYGYKVILSASTTVEYSSQLSGQITFNYTCSNGYCNGSSDTSTVRLSNPNPNWAVQADATFDPFVKVGLEGRVYPVGNWYLASAGIGFKFSTPLQVYGYYGNACGDADKDGYNELVNTYFADMQARVSLVASWSLLGGERVRYVSYGGWAGRKINGALYKVLNTEDNHTPLWNRRLFYTDSGSPSIFSPVLRQQAGSFTGSQYEHVLRVSMRPCVPFENNYFVDIVDPAGQVTTVTVPSRTATTTTKIYNGSSVWRLRASGSRDDDGRVFNNSSSVAPILDPAPPGGGNGGPGLFERVSNTRTTPGASGDMVTVTMRNAGTQTITSIAHSCTGGSFHVWGNGPTSLAPGQSGTYQCRAAASGSYAWPIFNISGSGASNSPFSQQLN
jgi:hypothetical protein